MTKFHTHYDNLKVARNAPQEVIRAAYKTLSQKYHPDRNPGDADAARIMSIINTSYDVLSDPVKRKEHDQWIAEQELFQRQSELRTSQTEPAEEIFQDTTRLIEKTASGQKFVIYAFLLHSIAIFLGDTAILVHIVAMILSLVGVFRMGTGLSFSTWAKIGLIILMFIPLLNMITLLILSIRATKILRASGLKVGFLGAKAPNNA